MYRLLVLFLFVSAGVAHAAPLTLDEATAAALARDPLVRQFEARGSAFAESAVADGALPDPELMGGIAELPLDGFGVASGEMKVYEVGVTQRFPPSGVRRSLAERGGRLADAEQLLAVDRQLEVRLAVARDWLDLLYIYEALEVVRDTRGRFDELTETIESRYAQGIGARDEVITVQLELMRLDEQESRLRQQLGAVRAALVRLVGDELVTRAPDLTVPRFADPDPNALRVGVMDHPRMRAYAARVDAGRLGEQSERSRSRPEFGLSVNYMRRTGRFGGMEMPDAVGARASVSLPLFTANRQDRRIAAAKAQTWEADAEREAERFELEFMLERALTDLAELRTQTDLYEQRLLPAASEYVATALNAYRAGSGDLLALVRAQIAEYDARLQHHGLILQLQRVRAELAYLMGEEA